MRLLTHCTTLGIVVLASWTLAVPAPAQTFSSASWIPAQPARFEHGWFWDPTGETWKFGWYQPGNIQAPPTRTQEFALAASETRSAPPMPTELRGTIINIDQRSIAYNAPPEVFATVRTEDGTLRTLDLGSAQFVFGSIPDLRQNQQVLLRGSLDNVAGRDFFSPRQLVTSRSTLTLPGFANNTRVRGTLINLYTIPGAGDFEKTLVAQVRTFDGDVVDVVLGPAAEVGNRFFSLRPGTPFVAEGMIEQTPSGATLYAQNVRVQERQPAEVITEAPSALALNVEPAPVQRFVPLPSTGETVRGQIVGLRQMWISGQSHLIADIVTDLGSFVRSDLGPTTAIEYLQLSPGEAISVSGQRLIVNGLSLLVANQFSARGQSLFIQSPPQLVGAIETTTVPVQVYHGQIIAKRREKIPGSGNDRLVADLRLDDGRVMPVELGLKRCLKGMDVDRNDYVTVWGNDGFVDGQPGLIAVQLADKDKQIQLAQCQ